MCSSASPNHSRHFPERRDFMSASSIPAIILSRFDSTSCGDLAAIQSIAYTRNTSNDNAYTNDSEMYPSDRCMQLRNRRGGAIPLNFVHSIIEHSSFLNKDLPWKACDRIDDPMRHHKSSVHCSRCRHPCMFVAFFTELARKKLKTDTLCPQTCFSIPRRKREPDSVHIESRPRTCVRVMAAPF